MRREIDRALEPLIAPGERCALLDFPDHPNVGDSAIWLGERRWLRERGADVRYVACIASFDEADARRAVGDGTILLHGGGNLGDVWPRHQEFRERVVERFPDNRIVMLPQSIHFDDDDNLRRCAEVFDAHGGVELVVRDRRSAEIASASFRARTHTSPDMAFALGPLQRPNEPVTDVFWLSRTDHEADPASIPALVPGVDRADWLGEPLGEAPWGVVGQLRLRLHDELRLRARSHSPAAVAADRLRQTVSTELARQRVERGCRLLATGRVVVTDRLHGHILCLLLGIPHVLLDNSYGKLSNALETWTDGVDGVRWATDPDDALRAARELLGSAAAGGALDGGA